MNITIQLPIGTTAEITVTDPNGIGVTIVEPGPKAMPKKKTAKP